jgi:hypothetical protein
MGDRAVIGFRADKEATPIFLYMHWGGSDRYIDTQRALEAARSRWNDPAYATRIAISQFVQNYWMEETGFGISAGYGSFCLPDYDDVILIDWAARAVLIVDVDDQTKVQMTTSFDSFLAMEAMV